MKDITYTSAQYQFLNFLETTLGIFNACLPLTAPVFKKIFGIGDKRNSNTVQDGIYKKLSHIAKVSGGWARRSTVWGTGRSTSLDADSETGNGGAPFGKENVSGPRGHTLGEALRRASMFEGENGAGLPSGRFETGNEKCIKIPLALVEVDEVPASPITRDQ